MEATFKRSLISEFIDLIEDSYIREPERFASQAISHRTQVN